MITYLRMSSAWHKGDGPAQVPRDLVGDGEARHPAVGLPPKGQRWNGTRVLYLLHPSDPVVWWSPDLIFSEPDWISQPPGRDVLSAMFWVPFVTFWLVTAAWSHIAWRGTFPASEPGRGQGRHRLGRRRAAGGNGDPVQVVGQHDLAAEGRRCLVGEPLAVTVLVALGEVGEDQQPCPGLGRDTPGLPGGEVPVVTRQRGLGVSEGGLTHHHVRAVGEGERAIAQPGIHDDREPLARSWLADLLKVHQPVTGDQVPLALQPPDGRAGDAQGGELAGQHPPPIGLH